jgi:hypothetical protein
VQLYIIQLHVSNFTCATHTKGNWKCILKYVDCNIQKKMCNCCLSAKHSPITFRQWTESNRQYYHSHYHCIICAALVRLVVQGKQVFLLFFHGLLFSRPGTCNKMSKIPELLTGISLILAWTQLEIEHNIEMKQLHC